MQEIKFRAWNKINKTMNKVKSLEFVAHQDGRLHFIDAGWKANPEEFELLQFTGLKDKNSKETYFDSDILQFHDSIFILRLYDETYKFVRPHIEWIKNERDWSYNEFAFNKSFECVIIGNIYETPEVLK